MTEKFVPYTGSYSRGGFEPQKNNKFVPAKGELFQEPSANRYIQKFVPRTGELFYGRATVKTYSTGLSPVRGSYS